MKKSLHVHRCTQIYNQHLANDKLLNNLFGRAVQADDCTENESDSFTCPTQEGFADLSYFWIQMIFSTFYNYITVKANADIIYIKNNGKD